MIITREHTLKKPLRVARILFHSGTLYLISPMNAVSALLRLVCGIAILAFAWISWSNNKAAVAAGEPLLLFGKSVEAGAGTTNLAYGVIALIGVGLLVLGISGLIRGRR